MDDQTPLQADAPPKPVSIGWALFLVVFGAYLLVCAYLVFTTGKWPIYAPPLFDFFFFLLGAWGGGAFLVLAGGGCVWLGWAALCRGA
jgi:hypothetical protein